MIYVLSYMSFPGPKAMHLSLRSAQVEVSASQGSPVLTHLGPAMFGVTSPKFEDANAATKGP